MSLLKKPQKYYSIATKLRWSYLLSSTLPLLLVGTILFYLSLASQESAISNIQHNRTQRIAQDIDTYLRPMRNAFDAYAKQVAVNDSQGQQELLAKELLEYGPQELLSLAIFDQQGMYLVDLRASDNRTENRPSLPPDSVAVDKALRFGTITYGPISFVEKNQYSFLLTLPIRNRTQAITSVLQAEVDATPIIYHIGTVDKETQRRTILVQEDNAQVLLPVGEVAIHPEDLRQMKQYSYSVSRYNRADGVGVIGSQAPVLVGDRNEQSNWIVIVDEPVTTAFGNTWNTAFLFIFFVMLATIFSLIIAYQQSRHLLKPLTILQDSAAALGAGYLNYRTEYTENDEFGDVTRAFNHMADQLQSSRNKIAQQNTRLLQGLNLARDIQIGLLPSTPPWSDDVMEVNAYSIPAFEVGGDFYSYKTLSHGRIAVGIGDISGKGVGAALMMALVSSTLEAQRQTIENPAQILTALNRQLLPRLQANNMNAALMVMMFDPDQALVRIANAGMIAPILISEQGIRLVDVGGLPLGAYDKALYKDQELLLSHGDTLLFV